MSRTVIDLLAVEERISDARQRRVRAEALLSSGREADKAQALELLAEVRDDMSALKAELERAHPALAAPRGAAAAAMLKRRHCQRESPEFI